MLFIRYETDKLQANCDYPRIALNTEVSEHGNNFVQIKHDLSIYKLTKTNEEKRDKNKMRTCRTPYCAKSYSHFFLGQAQQTIHLLAVNELTKYIRANNM